VPLSGSSPVFTPKRYPVLKLLWPKQLHWRILIALALGSLYGVVAVMTGLGDFSRDWIFPFGTIFLNLLKLVAMPLVFFCIVTGIASLGDLRQVGRIGGRAVLLFSLTTVAAITIGLGLATITRPGQFISEEKRIELQEKYAADAAVSGVRAEQAQVTRGPLSFLVDLFPENAVAAAGRNTGMLQVVAISVLFAFGLVQLKPERRQLVGSFCDAVADALIKVIGMIMWVAPLGVFALIAQAIITVAGDDPVAALGLLQALLAYVATAVGGMVIHLVVVYGLMLRFLSPISLPQFLRGVSPAILVGFSSSSSAATLPINMECVQKNLGASEEVTSFVMPLGSTINMDGTALYQAVAAVFIAQSINLELTLIQILSILGAALMASVGTAPVAGAGLIMLVAVLQAAGIPLEGLALVLGVDRIINMCRATLNTIGDAAITVIVAHQEGQLRVPDSARRR